MAKRIMVCTVELTIEVDEYQMAEDGVSALLTEQCQAAVPTSCLLDWQYVMHPKEIECGGCL